MTAPLGLTGKLPSAADFVRRGLDGAFARPWEIWLGRVMAEAHRVLEGRFDAAWATAPCLRFALPAGTVDERARAGVLVPSLDRVGRAFPLTVAAPLDPDANHFAVPDAWAPRLAAAEALAGTAMAGRLDVDALADALAALPVPPAPAVIGTVAAGYADLLAREAPDLGLWWTAGRPVQGRRGLPEAAEMAALLLGLPR